MRELDGLDSVALKEMINVYGIDTVIYWCIQYGTIDDSVLSYFLKQNKKLHRRLINKIH